MMDGKPARRAETEPHASPAAAASQRGAGILGVVAILGIAFALVQGTVIYRARSSARLMADEKNKILAQQVAEAGVEENIADLGTRKVRIDGAMSGFPTYTGSQVGAGYFSSSLTTLGVGPEADTVELLSTGRVAARSQSVKAKLRVRRYVDSVIDVSMYVEPESSFVNRLVTEPVTTVTLVPFDPSTMPLIPSTAAWAACLASPANKCEVCHLPPGNPTNVQTNSLPKNSNSMKTHFSHHGDYISTDGTCDIFEPHEESVTAMVTHTVIDTVVVDKTVYDTAYSLDTLAKVQILSWK